METFNQIDFWKYAYSNLIDNRNRAALAEYIVAKAVGANHNPETSWESYDIESPEGIKIEVKCSGYLQSWHQDKLSIPTFDIKRKYGWVADTNEFDNILDRQADVYVFCLHIAKELKDADPLKSNQWIFYVVSTSDINEKLGDQKTVRISTIETILGASPIQYDDLRNRILKYNK